MSSLDVTGCLLLPMALQILRGSWSLCWNPMEITMQIICGNLREAGLQVDMSCRCFEVM